MQKPSKWRFLADFYFSPNFANGLEMHLSALPWYFFYLIWALFSRNKLYKNTVGFGPENNGIVIIIIIIIIIIIYYYS